MANNNKIDLTQIRIIKKNSKEEFGDIDFWMSKTPEERISALEEIRKEYHSDKYSSGKVERVYRVVKRKASQDNKTF